MKSKLPEGKRLYFILALIGIMVILSVDCILFHIEDQNYNDKIEILCRMLEEQEQGKDSLTAASKLLKGEEGTKGQKGEERLKSYGYLSENDNRYSIQSKQQMIQTGLLSLIVYFGYLISLYIIIRQTKRQRHIEFLEFERCLMDFRKGIYELPGQLPYTLSDTDINRFYDQIKALGDYLRLMDERMTKEKEETKSLVTDISHQLKTPVAALKACFEILQLKDLKPEEKKEFQDRCSLQLKGLEDLLAALINISRMEAGMIQIKKEGACIYDTLVDAVNRIYLKASEQQIDIAMEAEEKLQQLRLPHDRKWLCEALINVLENAVKYSPPKTCITIHMIERTTFLRIEITDQGIGVPKEEYHQIFKRFYRGKSEEVKRQSGSGVGLYLTREIISRHGGTITVTSGNQALLTGSTFTIQLPYKS